MREIPEARSGPGWGVAFDLRKRRPTPSSNGFVLFCPPWFKPPTRTYSLNRNSFHMINKVFTLNTFPINQSLFKFCILFIIKYLKILKMNNRKKFFTLMRRRCTTLTRRSWRRRRIF